MARELGTSYQPKEVEDAIYKRWEASGFLSPDRLLPVNADTRRLKRGSTRKGQRGSTFTIIMPPPNANGPLHIGHAVFVTLQDIMIRFQRMRGKKTLWLPGADHAGFETQVVFDKKLEKEGRNRFSIPRDQLFKEMWDFTMVNKKVMEGQLRKLGASCDWSREKFTLDPDIVAVVNDTFKKMYEDGLLYRGERIVNWCVKHQTTLSDLEVKHEERTDPLYYITYGPLELATVRPETKFGDTAVAVHPSDKRYKKYVGKELEIETLLGPARIKVIADEAVDPKFGTGVIKVTPAHDPTDFEIGKRHKLEVRAVIGKDGRLNERAGPYAGLKVAEARKKVAEDMLARGLITKVDNSYTHNVAVCYKCRTVVEPLVMPQWFLSWTKTLPKSKKSIRDLAIEAVKKNKITFVPERSKKVFLHWMKILYDWNISRQIPWGSRIPAWYCKKHMRVSYSGELRAEYRDGGWMGSPVSKKVKNIRHSAFLIQPAFVGSSPPAKCPKCGEADLEQDPDVLDTWFSSGQWPYATLLAQRENSKLETRNSKLPENTKDFQEFYPTDVMETGYDILFFWVARMIMFGLYRTGKVPFKTVYLHGLVRDKDRQKMSKSKGNVIDPLGVAEQYGTDAVRMALTVGNLPGNDIIISEEKIRGYRNFANKIWNIHRFIVMRSEATRNRKQETAPAYSANDKKRLKELSVLITQVTRDLEAFKFHHAAEALYHYTWHTFADKIIEEARPRLDGTNPADAHAALALLMTIHETILKLLHPFMPFITEELWQDLGEETRSEKQETKGLLMVESWPHS